jgi:hypothetical protein
MPGAQLAVGFLSLNDTFTVLHVLSFKLVAKGQTS